MSYEIGYGSMKSAGQCAVSDSAYKETLSVVNQTMYEFTNLDPGLQYCVRVAGRTSAGVGPFSHTLIPCMCSYLVFHSLLMQPLTSDRIH